MAPPATTMTLKANVVSVDWVGSLICVRWFDQTNNVFDQMVFTVTRDTRIIKGTDDIFLTDLHQQDWVSIKYYDNDLGGLEPVSIEVSR